MRRILIAVVISAGMLAGCSSQEPVVDTPKVVGTVCLYVPEASDEFGAPNLVYDDGTFELIEGVLCK